MTMTDNAKTSNSRRTEHFDVLIVGAGISGVGSAYHLQEQAPNKSYVILEKYETFGGTWHMHTYPGVRSDSDLYTFGYRFKPWTSAPIASADEIKKYMAAVISENNIDNHIRYRLYLPQNKQQNNFFALDIFSAAIIPWISPLLDVLCRVDGCSLLAANE